MRVRGRVERENKVGDVRANEKSNSIRGGRANNRIARKREGSRRREFGFLESNKMKRRRNQK